MVAVANGSEDIETASIVDVLRRAEADVTTAKVGKNDTDLGSDKMSVLMQGLKVEADEILDQDLVDNNDYDAIVMPGGLPGSDHFRDCPILVQTLKKYLQDDSKVVGAICATPAVVLQTHGLLDGRKVTCYPYFGDQIDAAKYEADSSIVRSGNLLTSQGPGTAVEFAVALVEALYGKDKAKEVGDPLILKSGSDFYKH